MDGQRDKQRPCLRLFTSQGLVTYAKPSTPNKPIPSPFSSPAASGDDRRFNSPVRRQSERLVFSQLRRSTDIGRRIFQPAADSKRQELDARIAEAKASYRRAVDAILRGSKSAEAKALLRNSTLCNVKEIALRLVQTRPTLDQGKVTKMIDTLNYYNPVFDVLSQAGGIEFLPIIWGGMRLALMMTKNYHDFLPKLIDMLFDVGMYIRGAEGHVNIDPTDTMVGLISELYAAVVDFLRDVITFFQRVSIRVMLSCMLRPAEDRFDPAVARIQRLANHMRDESNLVQRYEVKRIASMVVKIGLDFRSCILQRRAVETALDEIPAAEIPLAFRPIKDALFRGFEQQANYHQDLAATYTVTSGAWDKWFEIEQKYLPSNICDTTKLIQGRCDAPDSQHALQWAEQRRERSPHVPWAYLIWAKGLTAHSAIASLVFQIMQHQRKSVLDVDIRTFAQANISTKKLWDLFVHLVRKFGGCSIYITIGSVGEHEFAIVEKFINTVKNWKDGPPLVVTLIHPFNEGFALVKGVTDLDGAYDVHPSLTTTDALHHVLMLELGVNDASDTIRTLLWESLWREVRYAVIGIALSEVTNVLTQAAESLVEQLDERELDERSKQAWLDGVTRWTEDNTASNTLREQIQRHLEIVPLDLPDEIRSALAEHLGLLVFRADTDRFDSLKSQFLAQMQRDMVWVRIQNVIQPGTRAMFCQSVQSAAKSCIDIFSLPSQDKARTKAVVVKLLNDRFGWESSWRSTFSTDKKVIEHGIAEGIKVGFADVMRILLGSNSKTASGEASNSPSRRRRV